MKWDDIEWNGKHGAYLCVIPDKGYSRRYIRFGKLGSTIG